MSELTPNTIIDSRYKIIKLIKIGGMGAVYQAEDLILDKRLCALKEMRDLSSNSNERQIAISRFLSEVQVLTKIIQPNIPQITNHFWENNSFYFVMDYIEGMDLATILKKEGCPGLAEAEVLNYALQVLEALDYLHNLSPPVIHSDIKPSNLILREEDQKILLIDFGIANAAQLNKGNYWLGTLGYASPEQMEGKKLSPASDLYSLGAAIYELLSGDKAYNLDQFKIASLEINFNLKNILQKLLNFKIKERFQSAKEVIEKVKEIIEMLENDYERFKYL